MGKFDGRVAIITGGGKGGGIGYGLSTAFATGCIQNTAYCNYDGNSSRYRSLYHF